MNYSLFTTNNGFLYAEKKTNRTIARADFVKRELKFEVDLDENTKDMMEWEMKEFVDGEVIKTPGGCVILGPIRDFKYEVCCHGCGNPDRQQYADIAPKRIVKACTIEEIVQIVKDFQSHNDMGMGNCAPDHGKVWDISKPGKRKRVGEVFYNGRFMTVAEKKAWDAKWKEKLA